MLTHSSRRAMTWRSGSSSALGGPPDIVIEAAGARGTLQQAVEFCRPGGTILSLGGCTAPDTVVPLLAMWKELKILFSAAYGAVDFRSRSMRWTPETSRRVRWSVTRSRSRRCRSGSNRCGPVRIPAKVMVDPTA